MGLIVPKLDWSFGVRAPKVNVPAPRVRVRVNVRVGQPPLPAQGGEELVQAVAQFVEHLLSQAAARRAPEWLDRILMV